jgi:hypothetical protein
MLMDSQMFRETLLRNLDNIQNNELSLNVVYLLMLNKDVTKHDNTWECACDSERGVPNPGY